MKESLDFVYKEQKELSTLGGIAALLGWDQMTYMPKLGAAARSEQSAMISKIAHEKIVSDSFWDHIQNLSQNFDSLSDKDKAIIKRLEEDVEKLHKSLTDIGCSMTDGGEVREDLCSALDENQWTDLINTFFRVK